MSPDKSISCWKLKELWQNQRNHSAALSTGNIRHKHSRLGQLFIGVKQELERNRLDDILQGTETAMAGKAKVEGLERIQNRP